MESNVIPLPEKNEVDPATGAYVPAPADDPQVFSDLQGRPMWWVDGIGRKHVCEAAEVDPDAFAVWTLCHHPIDPSEIYQPAPDERLTCEGCIAVVLDRQAREASAIEHAFPTPANDD